MMDISIVVPLFNEEESLPELLAWIERVCTSHQFSYEVVMIDDGSTDSSWAIVQQLAAQNVKPYKAML
jgi:glycosyltransferase involved in cell wall biosynthesis